MRRPTKAEWFDLGLIALVVFVAWQVWTWFVDRIGS